MRNQFKYVSLDEMREHLKYVRENRMVIFGDYKNYRNTDPKYHTTSYWAFISEKTSCLYLTYRRASKVCTYIFKLDGIMTMESEYSGADAIGILKKYFKVPECKFQLKDRKLIAAGVIYADEHTNGQRIDNCVGYDINSAYSWGMLQPMPDTTREQLGPGCVKDGEVGLTSDLKLARVGRFAMFRWPAMESPFRGFVDVWYSRKKNAAPGSQEKVNAKFILNASIGALQHHNPVLRAFILAYANARIESYIDRDTLMCSTDSIVSRKRRPDIEKDLGGEVGQWKIEHSGSFVHIGMTYQWNFDTPTYRGTPKGWFAQFEREHGRPWDLAVDDRPAGLNEYTFDPNTLTINHTRRIAR